MPKKQTNKSSIKSKTAISVPKRYIPDSLTTEDKLKQVLLLLKSRKDYKEKKYQTRKKLASFKSKPSSHVDTAKKMYGVKSMTHTRKLAEATGCSQSALKKIVNKGEGAYYSSGSRPNQTAKSWGLARLASSITGGPAAKVDFHIIAEGCDHEKSAYKLAEKAKATKSVKPGKVVLAINDKKSKKIP
jgi:hypothetical protein